MRRKKPVIRQPPEEPTNFTGQIIEIDSLNKIPSNSWLIEGKTIEEVAQIYERRTHKQPGTIFKFQRAMGIIYYAVYGHINDSIY